MSVPTMLHKAYRVECEINVQPGFDPPKKGSLLYCAPMSIVAGQSAPVALRCGPDSCGAERRVLRFEKLIRDTSRVVTLQKSSTGRLAVVINIEPVGAADGREAPSLNLHGTRVVMDIELGDAITSANGITDVDGIIDEFRRRPPVLALRFQRLIGTSENPNSQEINQEMNFYDFEDEASMTNETNESTEGIMHYRSDNEGISTECIMQLVPALDERFAPLVEEVQLHEYMMAENGALAYSILEFDAERLEHLYSLVEAQPPSPLSLELLKEAEKRLFFLTQRKNALKVENPILKLKYAVCDSQCDAELLLRAMKRFEKLPLGVRRSRLGKYLIARATDIQRLWEWRVEAKQLHHKLQVSLQDAQDREHEPDAVAPGGGMDQHEQNLFLWAAAKTKYSWTSLEELLVKTQPYLCMMEFDREASKVTIERLQQKLEKRKAQIFKVDALLLEMTDGPSAVEESDEDDY